MTEFFRYNEDAYTNINITLLRLSLVLVIFLEYKLKHTTNHIRTNKKTTNNSTIII